MKTMSKWFVLLSGVYDILLGAATLLGASTADAAARAAWTTAGTLGGALIFCGMVLIWASRDLTMRGPVVAWQGLLRFLAVGLIFTALGHYYVPSGLVGAMRAAAIIDFVVATGYFVVLIAVWRWTPVALLLGRSNAAARG